MELKSSGLRRASALTSLLLLVGSGMGSGCMKDLDALSENFGKGGKGGTGGKAGAAGRAGSGGSGDSGEGGEGGEAGEAGQPTGGKGGTGSAGKGGSGGKGGSVSSGGCGSSTTACFGDCVDLSVGSPIDDPNGDYVNNCGQCGTKCSLDNADNTTCTAGKCVPTCKSGFDDCDPAGDNNGCESDLSAPANCGGCKKACSANGTQALACTSGKCVATCNDRYLDCNAATVDPLHDDGCEVFLDALDACAPTAACTASGAVACSPLQVCNTGTCGPAAGVTVLSVPLSMAGQKHRFADIFSQTEPFVDLEGATVTVRLYAPNATAGTLFVWANDSTSNQSPTTLMLDLTNFNNKWTDVVLPLSSLASFNAKKVKQINTEIWAGSTGPWPAQTIVYVDRIWTSKKAINDTFDTTTGGYVNSSQVFVTGSTFTWAAAVP